jgi:4-amino-4-deoxy-L-arabinose transferase-like glycosyltransferase
MNKKIVVVFLVALIVRLLWVFAIADNIPNALGGDDWKLNPSSENISIGGVVSPDFNQVYDPGARGILDGDGFIGEDGRPTAYVGPGYSLFLAAHYSVFGFNLDVVRLTQILLGAISCVLLMLTAQILFNRKIGFISGILLALYPLDFYQSGLVISEQLFSFLFMLFVYINIKVFSNLKKGKITNTLLLSAFFCGIVLGLSALVRPNALIIPVALLLIILFSPNELRKNLLIIIGVIMVGFFISIMPWIIRNYILFDKFIPISGIIYHTFEELDGSVQTGFIDYIQKKIGRIIEDPLGTLKYVLTAPLIIWYKTNTGNMDKYLALLQFPVLATCIYGMVYSLKDYWIRIFSVILVLIFVGGLLVFTKNTLARYIVPIMPVILIFSAVFIDRLFNFKKNQYEK